jgi:hypothetical protein
MKVSRKLWLVFVSAVILALVGGWFVFSVGSPLNRGSAIRTTLKWGRLALFPVAASALHVETSGSPFTRQFRISFTGDPKKIEEWIAASPGTRGLLPERDSNGWFKFSIAPDQALIAEVHVSLDNRQVKVIAAWS